MIEPKDFVTSEHPFRLGIKEKTALAMLSPQVRNQICL